MSVTKLDDITLFIQNRKVINEIKNVEDLHFSLKLSVNIGKMNLLHRKIEQHTATISSVNNTHQAWSNGLSFSLEEENLCSPTKAPQQPEIDLVNKYEIIKQTSIDIKESLPSVTNIQLIVKLLITRILANLLKSLIDNYSKLREIWRKRAPPDTHLFADTNVTTN